MKYLYLFICLLTATSCTQTSKDWACFNPFLPIQSVQVTTPSETAKESGNFIEATDLSGNKAYFPKSLCVEVKRAEIN